MTWPESQFLKTKLLRTEADETNCQLRDGGDELPTMHSANIRPIRRNEAAHNLPCSADDGIFSL
jgi:hypothetical protein